MDPNKQFIDLETMTNEQLKILEKQEYPLKLTKFVEQGNPGDNIWGKH